MRDELTEKLAQKNYNLIPIPDEKPKEEYSTDQRRAWLLEKYLSEDTMNKKATAEEFGISNRQIHKDLNILRLWVRENPEQSMVDDTIKKAMVAVNKLMDEGKYYKAGKLNQNQLELLQEAGLIEKEPEKHDVNLKGGSVNFETLGDSSED
jgi:hypothetical protein